MNEREAIKSSETSEPVSWEVLDEYVRLQVQQLVQRALDQEADERLGRSRYHRRAAGEVGYRNGHGKSRRLALGCGTIEVRRPRLRGLEERFESRLLPLFKRQSKLVKGVLPQLYLEGLALRDFDRALRGLLGDGAPLSPSSIARLKEHWVQEYEAWRRERIEEQVVYLWADGIYVRAGLEKDKAAVLVVIGVFSDGSKRVLAIEAGFRESAESWKEVFEGLEQRGMNPPAALVADGGLGLWAAVAELGWQCKEQRCWNHKICNVRDALNVRDQKRGVELLRTIPNAETVEEAERRRDEFLRTFAANSKACARLLDDWTRMVTFYRLPREHWRGLRTTNIVESPFQIVRLRTGAARRFKKVENATAVLWKLLMVAETTFRTFDGHIHLERVARGRNYVNGVEVRDAAA